MMNSFSRMSLVLVASLFAAVSVPALASDTLVCETEALRSPTPGAEGISVTIDVNDKGVRAATMKKVIYSCSSGERFEKVTETNLVCHPFNPNHSSANSPDQPTIDTACSDPNAMDRGHEIYLSTGDLAGIKFAEVYQRYFWGQQFEAELPCRAGTPTVLAPTKR